MKELIATVASLAAWLGLYSADQPTLDDHQLRSDASAALVYASFAESSLPAPVVPPSPQPSPGVDDAEEKPVDVKPAPVPEVKPAPKPPVKPHVVPPKPKPQPAGSWQWVSYGRFGRMGHWVWVPSQPQQRRSGTTYYRRTCINGSCP